MELSHHATTPLSDKYDDGQMEEDIYNEASSNVDDVTIRLTPTSAYEPLNTNAGIIKRSNVVSRSKCILVGKLTLMLTVIVALVATSVVITMVVMTKGDAHKGYLSCFE